MSFMIRGRVWKYGDNINTDIISPGQYMSQPVEKQAEHAMGAIDPDFAKKVKPGDIIVAGHNFGSGSSRETAQMVLKHHQIGAIVSTSFARIFYRNSINVGLPVVEMKDTSVIQEGDEIEIDLIEGKVMNHTQGTEYQGTKLPEHLIEMVKLGGLEPFLVKKLLNS
ncbi:3-isopropylmalate dehydratase [Peribacillus castrilensis]|uniref:3-isopropylmalate dehydratase small subunit n=1 Tax=Peribacillus simplex TaxID=1478 RepID=A0AAN2PIV8_9BACI|nr:MULTISPECIES: 3-isopropylmalate dehydratase [Bacillaceae]MCF7621964.1 3-isopropylmalate dehydratase [Peribacillus frigoritolerans]MCP1156152.1 3-isopropylmalate dehydratase [Peribacillus frigoritolerans]MCT1391541.1 3-isopropylmalate dehydratase [Peribacillus frigoritolerans]WMX58597.1 3-isopropylmalate dehydratase [Peribacillus sp. R9-11]CEG33273.1 isopropylmalate isomerase small subunit [Peribacillus simplex]